MTCNQKFLNRSIHIELSQIAVSSFTRQVACSRVLTIRFLPTSKFLIKTQSEIADSVASFWIQKGLSKQSDLFVCRLFASRLCSNIFVKQTQCLTKQTKDKVYQFLFWHRSQAPKTFQWANYKTIMYLLVLYHVSKSNTKSSILIVLSRIKMRNCRCLNFY